MPIRVIAGSAKGRRLKLVPGDSTRPIMDRVKEALFSILGNQIRNIRFLDLFAGTGSVGIEALSRGASHVTFVDLDKMAIQTIYENLKITGLEKNAVVRRTSAFSLLKQSPPVPPYDIIYIAPPQYKDMWLDAVKLLDANPAWVPEGTRVIIQIDPHEYQNANLKNLVEYDQRTYGKTLLIFLHGRKDDEEK